MKILTSSGRMCPLESVPTVKSSAPIVCCVLSDKMSEY